MAEQAQAGGRAGKVITMSLLRWIAVRMFTMLCALSVFATTAHDWLPETVEADILFVFAIGTKKSSNQESIFDS